MASMEGDGAAYDWVDDEQMSAEETLRRFAELSPTPVGSPGPVEPDDRGDGTRSTLTASSARFHITGNSAVPSGPVTVDCFGLRKTG